MSKLTAGMLIGAAVLAGIYAIAATIAKTSAGTFTSAESASHARQAEFAATIHPAVAGKTGAHARCAPLVGPEKVRCAAAAEWTTNQMPTEAYQHALLPPAPDGIGATRTPYKIDIALYRAHRQWPD